MTLWSLNSLQSYILHPAGCALVVLLVPVQELVGKIHKNLKGEVFFPLSSSPVTLIQSLKIHREERQPALRGCHLKADVVPD